MHARFDRMVKRLNEITLGKNRAMLGGVYDVLIEGMSKTDKTMLTGRTPGGKLVNLRPPADTNAAGRINSAADCIGRILPVLLTETNTFSFTGEIAPIMPEHKRDRHFCVPVPLCSVLLCAPRYR
jgi:tRNA-2-methylthio-N6-dimethylallyladenosine synthase